MKKLGCGLGLRKEYHPYLLDQQVPEAWLKICSEDYMDSAGQPMATLEKLCKKFPILLHGSSLSVGSSDPVNDAYLKSLQVLIQRVQPEMVCDYLCWASTDQNYLHELLPLPMNIAVLDYVSERVDKIQEVLQQKINFANIAHYIRYQHSDLMEWDFLNRLTQRTGCGVVLDLNCVYVNSVNHHRDAGTYIRGISPDSVACIYLSGHQDMGSWLLNSHAEPIAEAVWDLYRECIKRMGQKPTIIESDQPFEELDDLRRDLSKANQIYASASGRTSADQAQSIVHPKKMKPKTTSGISLADTQRWVKANIFKIESNRKPDFDDEDVLMDPVEDHLRVYEMGYLSQISDALIQNYPSTFHMLGEHSFKVLAYEYAAEYKSRHYNVQKTGDRFPTFLKQHSAADRLPFLPDLAELERRIQHCYHANDEEPVGADILSRYAPEDWERLTFQFQPSFDLFESDWPVADMWHERNLHVTDHSKSLIGNSQKIMIYRKGYIPECKNVDNEIAWSILRHMYRGKTLGETLEIVGSEGESVLADLSSYFQVWTEGGIFCGVEAV